MAFTETWDETAPANTTSVGQGADAIRDTKTAIRERLAIDHNFKKDETGDNNIGKHSQVSLIEKSSHPTNPTAGIIFYDYGGKAYIRKKTGDPIQIVDETNQTIAGVKTFSSIPVLPNENPTSDNQAVRKKYVDDTVSAMELGERMILTDTKTAGTNGGTFTSGSWQTRDLNTVNYNSITGASLHSNRITLPAGVYHVKVYAPAFDVERHKAILYDATNSTVLLIGSSMFAENDCGVNNHSIIEGVITLTDETDIEVKHRCQTTKSNVGFGMACNFGVSEVYTQVSIIKIG